MDHSLFFEDYKVGLAAETSGRTITEADVVNFACFSGDFNPIHIDREFAKSGAFGERIAHGLLGLSVLSGLVHELGIIKSSVVAFVNLEWKFMGPVKIGDTIRGTFTTAKLRGLGPKQGLVIFDVALANQRGETCGEGRWSLMIKKKGTA